VTAARRILVTDPSTITRVAIWDDDGVPFSFAIGLTPSDSDAVLLLESWTATTLAARSPRQQADFWDYQFINLTRGTRVITGTPFPDGILIGTGVL
jgi:hypothetical protein